MMSPPRIWQHSDHTGGRHAILLIAAAAALLPDVALAHTGVGVVGGFLSGFTHPIFGFDHVVAW
jgi:urease accessory protein